MKRMTGNMLRIWPAFAAMAVVAGLVGVAMAQGSGTKRAGSESKAEAPKDEEKVEVKAELNAQALKAITGARVPVVLLDARGPSDQWLDGAMPLAPDADERAVRRAAGHPNRLIVTYCGGPECDLSQKLANHLAEHGYTNVIRFTGGIEAWTEAGFELKTNDDAKGSQTKKRSGSSAKPRGSSAR